MEYFQIGQQAISSSSGANSRSSNEFIQQVPQFHPPAPGGINGIGTHKQQQIQQNNFIKKEPESSIGFVFNLGRYLNFTKIFIIL
jgi:hypothetical protein